MDKLKKKNKPLYRERLLTAIDALRDRGSVINQVDFIVKSGILKSTFYAIIKNNRKPNLSTLSLLSEIGISREFVLTGEGSPLLERSAINEATGHEETGASGALAKDIEHLIRKIGSLPMRPQVKDGVVVHEREQAIAAIISSLKLLEVSELQRIVERAMGILEERQRAEQERPAAGV